ncbi:MAG TPA: type I-E CRISPR-associated protein Cse2/CasB [Gemmatimonas sp.]|uniref:type I-E CRISPR-associated protein Cse2/CasB n=1 Tax=Gemmatimonas sp. TaxID=1962908 RepID=UPI002EDB08B9
MNDNDRSVSGAQVSAGAEIKSESRQSSIVEWFNRLQESRNAGVRARLRRARNRAESLGEPMAIELARRLNGKKELQANDARTLAAIDLSRVLAHARQHEGRRRFMQQLGWQQFPGSQSESDAGAIRPILAEIRFRRVLLTTPGEDMVTTLIRLVRQLDGTVNVESLAWDMMDWYDENRREKVKQRWSFDYFAANQPTSTGATTN